MGITIKTNNVPRPIVCGWELTEKEAAEFDYLDDITEGGFFRYKGEVYDLGEFCRVIPAGSKSYHPCDMHDIGGDFKNWQGYISDSYFSGIVIRYTEDLEHVIVGTYFS